MGKSAVNRLRLFSIARFDHQRVSSICPQSPRASEDDCSRHADDFGTFQARNPKKDLRSLQCLSLKSHPVENWNPIRVVKTTCLFVVALIPCSFFTLFHVCWISRIPAADCTPAGLGDLDTFSGHDQLCGTGGIGAPTGKRWNPVEFSINMGVSPTKYGWFSQETWEHTNFINKIWWSYHQR